MVMVALDITPREAYTNAGKAFLSAWDWIRELLAGSWGQALIWGACIVVPVWLVFMGILFFRRLTKNDSPPF